MEPESIKAAKADAEQCGISKVPQDLKELIFAKLPLESICGSRIVCKEWNFILSLHNFLSSLQIQHPWILICNDEKDGNWCCMAYCFSTQKWRTLSLSFLPKPKRTRFLPNTGQGCISRFLYSAGQGLLHFHDFITQQLVVCNPLTKSYVEIEIDVSHKYMHIIQRGNKEPYLVACSASTNFSLQVYHYFQDSWKIKFQFAREVQLSDIVDLERVECNGVLFWRGKSQSSIIGFKIQDEGFISPVTIAPLPAEMVEDLNGFLSMVSYGSSVLVVCVIDMIHPSTQNGIVIWELFQDEENELVWKWKEFLRIPPLSLLEYLDEDWWWWRVSCVCVGDYLCFSNLYAADESVRVVAYNLKEGFWQRLLLCKIQNTKRYRKMLSFEPKPYLYQFFRKSREGAYMTR